MKTETVELPEGTMQAIANHLMTLPLVQLALAVQAAKFVKEEKDEEPK